MARRRMFSSDVVDSDTFLDMPATSRCLYYELGMRADDDGFVSPNKVLRLTGASKEDLQNLIDKGLIFLFKTGIAVIRDWKMNNYIQRDRYTKTIYKEEKSKLHENSNGSYTLDTEWIQNVSNLDTTCIQNVSKMDTQVRLGKVSIGKNKGVQGERSPSRKSEKKLLSVEEAIEVINSPETIQALRAEFGKEFRESLDLPAAADWLRKKENSSKLSGRRDPVAFIKGWVRRTVRSKLDRGLPVELPPKITKDGWDPRIPERLKVFTHLKGIPDHYEYCQEQGLLNLTEEQIQQQLEEMKTHTPSGPRRSFTLLEEEKKQ